MDMELNVSQRWCEKSQSRIGLLAEGTGQILEIAGPRKYITALIGQEILIPPNSPSAGVKVATILDHGAHQLN
jgi:hypothetical protein